MQLKINELLKELLKESKNNNIRVYIDTQNNHYEGNLLLDTLDDIEDDHITITAFSYRIDKTFEE